MFRVKSIALKKNVDSTTDIKIKQHLIWYWCWIASITIETFHKKPLNRIIETSFMLPVTQIHVYWTHMNKILHVPKIYFLHEYRQKKIPNDHQNTSDSDFNYINMLFTKNRHKLVKWLWIWQFLLVSSYSPKANINTLSVIYMINSIKHNRLFFK